MTGKNELQHSMPESVMVVPDDKNPDDKNPSKVMRDILDGKQGSCITSVIARWLEKSKKGKVLTIDISHKPDKKTHTSTPLCTLIITPDSSVDGSSGDKILDEILEFLSVEDKMTLAEMGLDKNIIPDTTDPEVYLKGDIFAPVKKGYCIGETTVYVIFVSAKMVRMKCSQIRELLQRISDEMEKPKQGEISIV